MSQLAESGQLGGEIVKVSVLHNLAGRPYEQQKLNEPPRASGDRVLLINRGFQRHPPTYNYEERQGLMTRGLP